MSKLNILKFKNTLYCNSQGNQHTHIHYFKKTLKYLHYFTIYYSLLHNYLMNNK